MKHCFLLFALFLSIQLQAQTLVLKGLVRGANDSIPIPFCNVYVNYTGTFTNEAGAFELRLASVDPEDSLAVSAIGYLTFKTALASLSGNTKLLIDLEQHTQVLDDVVVTASEDTLGRLIQQAVQRIPKNYPTSTFYLDGFFRELVMRDSLYVRLQEAAIGVQDRGFIRAPEDLKVRVLALRKSEDYLNYSFFSNKKERTNNLYKTFTFDEIRNYNTESFKFFEEGLLKRDFAFRLVSTQYLNNEAIYVIEFKPEVDRGFDIQGRIFINSQDLGIMRLEVNHLHNAEIAPGNSEQIFFNGNIYKTSVVQYQKLGKKYYLSYIKWMTPVSSAWTTSNDEGEHALQFFDCAFYVNEIYTKKRDFDKIKKRESEKKEVDLYSQEFEYDPEFWKNFNTVLINPLYKKAETDLEKEKQLEAQYNGH